MAMTKRRRRILLVALLLLLVGTLSLHAIFRSSAPTPGTEQATSAAAEADAIDTTRTRHSLALSVASFDAAQREALTEPTARSASDLPEFATPVREWLADLRQRAAHGDAAASCRLAAALQDCAAQEVGFDPLRQADLTAWRLQAFRGSDGERAQFAEMLETQSQQTLSRYQRCQDVAGDVIALWPWYLLRAADAGYPDAMLTASDPFSYRPEILLQQAGLAEALHQRIPSYLRRLLEQGSIRALGPLHVWLTEPGMAAQLGVLPRGFQDAEIVLALTRRAEQEFELRFAVPLTVPGAANPWDNLNDDQRSLAEQLWQTYFGPGSEHDALLQYPPSELEKLPMLPINPERRARSCAEPAAR